MNHKRYCPDGCLHVLTDAWQCLVKFTQSDVDSTVEYITGVFLFYDNEYNNEAIREKKVFFKTAVLIDDVRSNVILTDSTHGFMVSYDKDIEHFDTLPCDITDVIENEILIMRYEMNEDPDDESTPRSYNYIYPGSDKSIEVAKLVDKIFFNIVNMEKVEAYMPNMPRDVQLCVLGKMWQDPIINVPTVDPHFITKCTNAYSRKHYRHILCEWFRKSYCDQIKSYLDHLD